MTSIQVKMNKYDQLYMLQQMQVLTTAQMPQYYPVLVFAKLHQLGCVGFAQKHVLVSSQSMSSSKITQKSPEIHGKPESPLKSMTIPWKTMKIGGVSTSFTMGFPQIPMGSSSASPALGGRRSRHQDRLRRQWHLCRLDVRCLGVLF